LKGKSTGKRELVNDGEGEDSRFTILVKGEFLRRHNLENRRE